MSHALKNIFLTISCDPSKILKADDSYFDPNFGLDIMRRYSVLFHANPGIPIRINRNQLFNPRRSEVRMNTIEYNAILSKTITRAVKLFLIQF